MIIRADARSIPLRDGCVDCCVTSPPYFGLRDYGHTQQIGLEATPDAYVATLVMVFQEVKRVLKDRGTLWLNLGDSYTSAGGGGEARMIELGKPTGGTFRRGIVEHGRSGLRPFHSMGAKPKDLLGIPWRVAFALQADGWYLRSDIIWSKPNPMPESVTDRPTKAHEYVFLLTKSERYYYDAAAIAEKAGDFRGTVLINRESGTGKARGMDGQADRQGNFKALDHGRNKRSVWTVPTMPYSGAHFATFPERLIVPCILAGCPAGGVVLDPFVGSGTVGAVAERFGRRWIGGDINYQSLARERTAQRGLMFAI